MPCKITHTHDSTTHTRDRLLVAVRTFLRRPQPTLSLSVTFHPFLIFIFLRLHCIGVRRGKVIFGSVTREGKRRLPTLVPLNSTPEDDRSCPILDAKSAYRAGGACTHVNTLQRSWKGRFGLLNSLSGGSRIGQEHSHESASLVIGKRSSKQDMLQRERENIGSCCVEIESGGDSECLLALVLPDLCGGRGNAR